MNGITYNASLKLDKAKFKLEEAQQHLTTLQGSLETTTDKNAKVELQFKVKKAKELVAARKISVEQAQKTLDEKLFDSSQKLESKKAQMRIQLKMLEQKREMIDLQIEGIKEKISAIG